MPNLRNIPDPFVGKQVDNYIEEPSVELPFNYDGPFRAYLNSAYPGGIVAAGQPYPDRLFAYHLQLFFPDSKLLTPSSRARDHFQIFPEMGMHQYSALGYLSVDRWPRDRLFVSRPLLTGQLISALKNKEYVFTYIDEFYVPQRPAYRRHHFRHEILIHAWNGSTQSFIGATYRGDGSFGPVDLSPSEVFDGIFSEQGRLPGWYSESTDAWSIRLQSPPQEPVRPDFVIAQLRDYASGCDNSHQYMGGSFSIPNYEMAKSLHPVKSDRAGTYGIRVYDHCRRYAEIVLKNRETIDLRASRVLVEHKLAVCGCLRLLSPDRVSSNVLNAYKVILGLAQKLHLLAFALNMNRDDRYQLRVIPMLDELQSSEQRILGELVGA